MTAVRAITRVQDADDVTLAGAANNDPIVFDSSTGGMKKGTAGSADKLGLTPTAVKTAGYTAAAGDLVPVDTTSGAVTVTLPTAPADGTVIGIKHVIQGGTNAVTYATGGSDVINKASGATSGTLPTLAQGVILQYKASSAIWYVDANDLALSQLDLRYYSVGGADVAVADGGTGASTASTARSNLGIPAAVGGVEWTVITKAADESVASSTTLQNDDDFFFPAVSGAQYEIEILVVYGSPSGAATPDLKMAFGEDSTGRAVVTQIGGLSTADGNGTAVSAIANQTSLISVGTAATDRMVKLYSSYVGAGGTFRMLWAQATSGAGATIVRAGSVLRYRRIV